MLDGTRVVTGAEMAAIDRKTIEELGLPGLLLMETAGRSVAAACERYRTDAARAAIVVGPGNNGGDGYVVARTLANLGWRVELFSLVDGEKLKGDAAKNFELSQAWQLPWRRFDTDCFDSGYWNGFSVVVDALFGTGLTRPLEGDAAKLVEAVNQARVPLVAVDIPSGVSSETGQVLGTAFRAAQTVTFGLPKYGHFLYPGAELAGELTVAEIGFFGSLLDDEGIRGKLLGPALVGGWLPRRSPTAHKGTCGRALLLVGSTRYPGAAALATLGALRSGAGLTYTAVPAAIRGWLEPGSFEAIFIEREDSAHLEEVLSGADAVCVGCGLHQDLKLAESLLKRASAPVVVDADALSLLDEAEPEASRVLTPHPGEMGRLLGVSAAEIEADRPAAARESASRFNAVTVLKGNPTLIASPGGQLLINSTGGASLAQGGSGDVLAGVITGMLAQGLSAEKAAAAGVYLHGLAADRLASRRGCWGFGATALAEELPGALSQLLDGFVDR